MIQFLLSVLLLSLYPLVVQAQTLDGSWEGTFADEIGTGKVYFNLFQTNEGTVVGTYASSLGGGGRIFGKLNDSKMEFELTQTVADCPGTYKGLLILKENTGAGTYVGKDCLGDHGTGTITIARITSGESAATSGQQPAIIDYGDPSELTNTKAVYVYTGTDLEVRNNIIKNLKKYRALHVVNAPEEADVILIYGAQYFSFGSSVYVWSSGYGSGFGSAIPRRGVAGLGYAAILIPPNRLRLLWQFEDEARTRFERRPSTNFARNFIKLMKKLREEK